MKVWERHSLFVVPFVIAGVALRRGVETARLVYWRRVFGWRIGRNVRVHWTVHIPKLIQVTLSDDVVIGKHTEIWSEVPGAIFELGRGTDVARDCMLDASGGLVVGANVTVSEAVVIYTHSHGRDPRSNPAYLPMSIGDDVWICTRALILATARTIGTHAIVGPYAVVRRAVPENSVVRSGEPSAGDVRIDIGNRAKRTPNVEKTST